MIVFAIICLVAFQNCNQVPALLSPSEQVQESFLSDSDDKNPYSADAKPEFLCRNESLPGSLLGKDVILAYGDQLYCEFLARRADIRSHSLDLDANTYDFIAPQDLNRLRQLGWVALSDNADGKHIYRRANANEITKRYRVLLYNGNSMSSIDSVNIVYLGSSNTLGRLNFNCANKTKSPTTFSKNVLIAQNETIRCEVDFNSELTGNSLKLMENKFDRVQPYFLSELKSFGWTESVSRSGKKILVYEKVNTVTTVIQSRSYLYLKNSGNDLVDAVEITYLPSNSNIHNINDPVCRPLEINGFATFGIIGSTNNQGYCENTVCDSENGFVAPIAKDINGKIFRCGQ